MDEIMYTIDDILCNGLCNMVVEVTPAPPEGFLSVQLISNAYKKPFYIIAISKFVLMMKLKMGESS